MVLLFTLIVIVIVVGVFKDCTSPTINDCPINPPATADTTTNIQMNLGGGTLTASKVNGTKITGSSNICIGSTESPTCIEEKHLKVLIGALPFGIINSGEGNWLGREHGDQNAWFHNQYDGYGALYFRNMGVVP